jgi:hypothetical protein
MFYKVKMRLFCKSKLVNSYHIANLNWCTKYISCLLTYSSLSFSGCSCVERISVCASPIWSYCGHRSSCAEGQIPDSSSLSSEYYLQLIYQSFLACKCETKVHSMMRWSTFQIQCIKKGCIMFGTVDRCFFCVAYKCSINFFSQWKLPVQTCIRKNSF